MIGKDTNSSEKKEFLDMVLHSIIDGTKKPRVQVERQISPFLDVFIEEIVNSKFKNDHFKLIESEFPIEAIKNSGTNLLSSSIDYLLVSEQSKTILIVELKTDSQSFKPDQYKNYVRLSAEIKKHSAQYLIDFLSKLKHRKFVSYRKEILEAQRNVPWNHIKKCKILYIAPKQILLRRWGQKTRELIKEIDFLHFSQMPEELNTPHSKEWTILRDYLLSLDSN